MVFDDVSSVSSGESSIFWRTTLALTGFQNDLDMLYQRCQTDTWRCLDWMDMLWFVLWLSRYHPRSSIPVSECTEVPGKVP
jgi:hypothetical protein